MALVVAALALLLHHGAGDAVGVRHGGHGAAGSYSSAPRGKAADMQSRAPLNGSSVHVDGAMGGSCAAPHCASADVRGFSLAAPVAGALAGDAAALPGRVAAAADAPRAHGPPPDLSVLSVLRI
ncbi:DUF6153 family protein [Mangrovactinospora gilvigrisea]|uniref:DUF6153 family protein n=1 Tax=Mangrovactinospora gilvigrisea TaxID=1428644 RepID=UPI001114FC69|nr:DUF6153 family protein [Mangrovactinospora gilvigrisea]